MRDIRSAMLVALLLVACSVVSGARSQASEPGPAKMIYLLPENFHGWVCVDFGIAGAPPLPREGKVLVIQPRPGEVLKTSDKPGEPPYFPEAFFKKNGRRRPLPQEERKVASHSDSNNPVARNCNFFGTEDEADAAGEPPGFKPSPRELQGIPAEERQALVELFNSTDGSHWKHHVGWLGPPGTECSWHGVTCGGRFSSEPLTVGSLDLSENNLVGNVPESLAQLKDLDRLLIFGNHLSGALPQPLIQRWLAGPLDISVEEPQLSDISEIDFEAAATAVLCAQHRIILRSDRTATQFTERCRNAKPGDRTTFCEVKEGHLWRGGFAKLAWLIEKNGFFALEPNYDRNITHGGFESTRVMRNGKDYSVVNYADAGPSELWTIQRAIEGVAASAEWEKTSRRAKCPRWDEADIGHQH